jgi:prepilin-type N-terminal cleavage/methylation domain-containing protein
MTRQRRHDGFTLIEVLIAMTLSLIVFAATLSSLNVFSSDSQAMTQRNDAQNQARLAIDKIARQLRNIASPVTNQKLLDVASDYDIVFQTVGAPNGNNTAGNERVRYCIPADTSPGTPSHEALFEQVETWTSSTPPSTPPLSNPWDPSLWPGGNVPCPDPGYPYTAIYGVTNRYVSATHTTHPAFSYNGGAAPADIAQIDSVGIDLFVNPTTRLANAETELRSGVFLRNQERQPVASFSYTPLGNGSVLLNAGTSYSPSGESLAYSWSCSGGTPCTSSGGVFVWKPGPGTYTVTLTVTDQGGLTDTQTNQAVQVS